jgi:hypothetical protein
MLSFLRSSVIAALLLAVLAGSGCGSKPPETVIVNQTVTVVRTATPTKPVATPKLINVPVNLALGPTSEYAAFSIPIFLTTDQTLHLSWKSDGGSFQMKVINPLGEIAGVDMMGLSEADSDAELDYIGGFTFSPAEYEGPGWSNGFYYFVPKITKGQGPVKLTVSYWTEGFTRTNPTASTNKTTTTPAATTG